MIRHPQILANEVLLESDHPSAGRLRQTRAPARFSGTPTGLRYPAPDLGEHTAEILSEAGLVRADIDALFASGAAQGHRP